MLLARGPVALDAYGDSEYSGTESEPPSPPPTRKGKAVAGPSRKRKRARRHSHRRCAEVGGFMADGRRAYHPSPGSPPRSHPVRPLGEPDADGFYSIRSRRLLRRRSPPRPPKPVPPELQGLCFNCLASTHVKAACRIRPRCFNCWHEGHRASACRLPLRRGLSTTTGAKRSRSPADGRGDSRDLRRRQAP